MTLQKAEPAARAAGDPGPGTGLVPGLLEKLLAEVRPEFRAEVLVIDRRDPVFGGERCLVPGCERAGRTRGLCDGHYDRWRQRGRPADVEPFALSEDCDWYGSSPLKTCAVSWCRYGSSRKGLCARHHDAWERSGRPEVGAWVAIQAPVEDRAVPPACKIGICELWAEDGQLCRSHHRRWRTHGCPDLDEFCRLCEEPRQAYETLDLRSLGPQLRLELQYALQRRRDELEARIRPGVVREVVRYLAGQPLTSLMELPERVQIERDSGLHKQPAGLIKRARLAVGDLALGTGWEVEYARDTWRMRSLGIKGIGTSPCLQFGGIPQPWLKDLAKRWARWQLSRGLSGNVVYKDVSVVTHFARFLARPGTGVDCLAQVDRAVLERYLAESRSEIASEALRKHLGMLHSFFQAIRLHAWDTSLPASAMFFAEDKPRQAKRLPRYLAEQVMTQLEDPANLARWEDPARRLITLILIRCGLRITDGVQLPFDCVICDAGGAPFLRYYNHKMEREAVVPIDEELQQMIGEQQRAVIERWSASKPYLFPRPTANLEGDKPVTASAYRAGLYRWLEACDIRDAHGQPVKLTPHQLRHTLGTRLINRDVPQEIVRRLLDHDTAEMTAHYARLHDSTVRRHWEQARKVNATGQPVTLDPNSPLAAASWAKQRLGRATQALPNGYCSLPVIKTCPHANACLTCPMFLTTAEFLPQHISHRSQVLQIISAAEAQGHDRVAEMNRQVAGNLQKIITALESEEPGHPQEAAADAS